MLSKRINTLWIVAGAAALSFTGSMIGVAQLPDDVHVVAHVDVRWNGRNIGACDTSA